MNNEEQVMIGRLQTHVQRLAGEIGERNIWQPAALADAAAYIESQWSKQGYAVKRQTYDVTGRPLTTRNSRPPMPMA